MGIGKIVHVLGNFRHIFAADGVLTLNRDFIQSHGLIAAHGMFDIAPDSPTKLVFSGILPVPAAYSQQNFDWLAAKRETSTGNDSRVCLFWPFYGYFPDYIKHVYEQTRAVCPNAGQSFLWACARPDIEMESLLEYGVLSKAVAHTPVTYRQLLETPGLLISSSLKDEPVNPLAGLLYLHSLQGRGLAGLEVLVDNGEPDFGGALAGKICEHASIMPAWVDTGEHIPPAGPVDFKLPPALLFFINAIQNLYYSMLMLGMHGSPLYADMHMQRGYGEFSALYPAIMECMTVFAREPQRHSLLSANLRHDIIKKYMPFIRQVEIITGRKADFPQLSASDLLPQYGDLSFDDAARAVKSLPDGFAALLLEMLRRFPSCMLKPDMAVLKQAMERAAGENFARVAVGDTPAEDYKVTVCTLTANHEKFIADNIESVLAQKTDFPVRHLIMDAGASDGIRGLVEGYAKQHPGSITYIHHPWLFEGEGIWEMFNRANSPYVALLDGDDYFIDDHKLQKQADFLDKHQDCTVCFHVAKVLFEDTPEHEEYYPSENYLRRGVRQFYYLTDLLRLNMMQTGSVMYRWRFKDGLPDWFVPDLTPGDWYWHILHAEIGKIGFINEPMSVYRRHKDSLFYGTHVDMTAHRAKWGLDELICYNTVNRRLGGRYFSILGPKSFSVFGDLINYAKTHNDFKLVEKAALTCPDFARIALPRIAEHEKVNIDYIMAMLPDSANNGN